MHEVVRDVDAVQRGSQGLGAYDVKLGGCELGPPRRERVRMPAGDVRGVAVLHQTIHQP
jgi:hypothetical protein